MPFSLLHIFEKEQNRGYLKKPTFFPILLKKLKVKSLIYKEKSKIILHKKKAFRNPQAMS